jgi:hypothetical protein
MSNRVVLTGCAIGLKLSSRSVSPCGPAQPAGVKAERSPKEGTPCAFLFFCQFAPTQRNGEKMATNQRPDYLSLNKNIRKRLSHAKRKNEDRHYVQLVQQWAAESLEKKEPQALPSLGDSQETETS